MKRFTLGLALATMIGVFAFALAPAANAATPTVTNVATVPITGTITDVTGGTFSGTFDITKFTTQNGQLAAAGTLTGTLTDALGNVIGTVGPTSVTMPATASGSCQVLHLELGPLDLNLLGLQVHLDRVVLDITAQAGPGNLVGNLLCGIAGLLDSGAPLNQVVALLNNLLTLFG